MNSNNLLKGSLRGSSRLEETESNSDEEVSVSLLKQRNRANNLPLVNSGNASQNSQKVEHNENVKR